MMDNLDKAIKIVNGEKLSYIYKIFIEAETEFDIANLILEFATDVINIKRHKNTNRIIFSNYYDNTIIRNCFATIKNNEIIFNGETVLDIKIDGNNWTYIKSLDTKLIIFL